MLIRAHSVTYEGRGQCWFSPSTMWVPEIKHRSSDLAAVLLPTNPLAWAMLAIFKRETYAQTTAFLLALTASFRGTMQSNHYPCTEKGRQISLHMGKPSLLVVSTLANPILRSRPPSMKKEHQWGWPELPFSRLGPRWQFMWKKWKRNQDGLQSWWESCFSFCSTFWSC